MNQKEVMYTNTVNQWKTSVTRFIQGLSQQDQLDLQKMIVYKKRADDVYNIAEASQNLYKTLRVNHESLVGIAAEQILFFQVQMYKSKQQQRDLLPKVVRVQFTIKDRFYAQRATGVVTLSVNKLFIVSELAEMRAILQVYTDARGGKYSQAEFDQKLQEVQPEQLGDDECQLLRDRIRMNLAEFLDFGCICY